MTLTVPYPLCTGRNAVERSSEQGSCALYITPLPRSKKSIGGFPLHGSAHMGTCTTRSSCIFRNDDFCASPRNTSKVLWPCTADHGLDA